LLKNSLLVITSVVFALAVFAGLFEAVASYRYDRWKAEFVEKGGLYGKLTVPSGNEVLVWEYRPDAVGETWGIRIHTNEHGFRDGSRAYDKREGDLRVAFVGDSVTLGLGVEADATFVSVFEQEASRRAPPVKVEAMSLAVGGYSAIQALELLRDKVTRFSPDIAIYVMCMNDFDFVHSSGQIMKYFKKPENFFFRFAERVYAKFFVEHYYEYHFRKNRDVVFAEILKLSAEMDDRGIDFRIALMPIFETDGVYSEYAIMDMHMEIVATLVENGILVVDLLGEFQKAGLRDSSLAFDDIHLTEPGHRIAARRFVDELL
jgi:lysophospholipase L1-like esterase